MFELTNLEESFASESILLKDVCDSFGLRHDNEMESFKKMIKSVNLEETKARKNPFLKNANGEFSGFKFKFTDVTIRDGLGIKTTLKSVQLNFRTLVWFISKKNHLLRLRLVDFVFNKLETERLEAIQELKVQHEIELKENVRYTNSNPYSRIERHEELMELVEKGVLKHWIVKKPIHKYELTQYGEHLGYQMKNGVVTRNF